MKKTLVIAALLALLFLIPLAAAKTTMFVPAVDNSGNGVLTTVTADVKAGTGKEFVYIEPFISLETQQSSKTAATVAAKQAGVNKNDFDIFFEVIANAQVVDGPSGGGALALLAYAEYSKKTIRSDLSVTGTINQDGSIGPVGGIFGKAQAASKKGIKVLLIPRNQKVQNGVDLTSYAPANWGMQVIEASNLTKVIEYAATAAGSRISAVADNVKPLNLTKISTSGAAGGLKEIAEKELARVQKLAGGLADGVVKNNSLESIGNAKEMLSKGYYYSSANTLFITGISIESFNGKNESKAQLAKQLSGLESQVNNTRFAKKNLNNFEWITGAQMRFYWAREKLGSIRQLIEANNADAAAQEISVAKSWLNAASGMNKIGAAISGEEFDELRLRNYANLLLQKAEQSNPALSQEAMQHLVYARAEFGESAYLAAAFDAVFTASFTAPAGNASYAKPLFEEYGDFAKTVWPQVYFGHALYNSQEFERTGDGESEENAVKLAGLSYALKQVVEDVPAEARKPYVAPAMPAANGSNPIEGINTVAPGGSVGQNDSRQISVQVQTLPKKEAAGLLSQKNLVALSLLLVIACVVAMIFLLKNKKPAGQEKLAWSSREKLEKAEEMLLEGKISEKTFEHLLSKYKNTVEKTSRVAKARKKRR
ncbi:hypothetical protein HY993_00280 [Candidatus Micrarchaeota archaeon]|nr:hypothetical protein [Candidatus Micrarchaeota archaeon]